MLAAVATGEGSELAVNALIGSDAGIGGCSVVGVPALDDAALLWRE